MKKLKKQLTLALGLFLLGATSYAELDDYENCVYEAAYKQSMGIKKANENYNESIDYCLTLENRPHAVVNCFKKAEEKLDQEKNDIDESFYRRRFGCMKLYL